jgi:hypothetical protein
VSKYTLEQIQITANMWHDFLEEKVAEGLGHISEAWFTQWLQKKLAEAQDPTTNQNERKGD